MKRVSFVLAGAFAVWALVLAAPVGAAPRGHAAMRGAVIEGHSDFDHGRGLQGPVIVGGFDNPFWFGYAWGPYWNYWAPFYGYYPYGPGYYARHYDGGIKLKINGPNPKDAEVFANGAYVGTVDDFNGTFQKLSLRPGDYTIEVRANGYQPFTLKVRIQPDRTITYRGEMRKVE